ncbi:MAG: hypothetical protein L6N95_03205 [Candidatus Methylarchaceae archaeon HK01B]|nr:hypothetical protein [Candidatus Methylarchaceae archaeon HK01M]MCP8311349.1 hypothetical protein [Candidatus Methylarchaceae archaeon HK02M1]MCP8318817.1 hypothetical protein [Candidatus Methylarchaceae archaeon HK01B]
MVKISDKARVPFQIKRERLVHEALGRYIRLLKSDYKIIDPSNKSLKKVTKIYSKIWNDPALCDKLLIWSGFKKLDISNGPPKGGDIVILAYAVDLVSEGSIELLTFDHDFIVFSDEIYRELGVNVRNAGTLQK